MAKVTRRRVSRIMLKLAVLVSLKLLPIGIVSLMTGQTYNTVNVFHCHSDLKRRQLCFIDDDSGGF